jgi:hypothetical protein
MKAIKELGLTYQGRLITSVIEGADARRAQICPGFVQINCQGSNGIDNSAGIQIPVSQWTDIQRRGAA